jgi:hypothetical protein
MTALRFVEPRKCAARRIVLGALSSEDKNRPKQGREYLMTMTKQEIVRLRELLDQATRGKNTPEEATLLIKREMPHLRAKYVKRLCTVAAEIERMKAAECWD